MDLAATTREEPLDEAGDREDGSAAEADGALEARREEVRRRLTATGFVANPLERLVFGTGHAVRRLLRLPQPPSYWASAVVLTGILLLIYAVETWIAEGFREDRADLVSLRLALLGALFVVLVVVRLCTLALASTAKDRLLDSMRSASDLADLERRLDSGSWKQWTVLGLFYGLGVEWLYSRFIYEPAYGPSSLSVHGVFVTACFGLAIYAVFRFWVWLGRLGGYRLRLFGPDPSSSEVIVALSELIRRIVTLIAVGGVAVTLVFTLHGVTGPLSVAILLAILWIPMIAAFATGQVSLAKLITTAKRETLREVQRKVETLESKGSLDDRETMDAVTRLLDYHDRIRGTASSAIDLRAGLNLFQSLLLPVAALVLANLERILELLGLAETLGLGS